MKTVVQKGTPEENAIIQNVASLVQQLQAMAAGDASMTPDAVGGPGGGQPVQGAAFGSGQAMKSGEGAEGNTGENAFNRTEDPQNDTSQEGPTARRPTMRNAQIQKAAMPDKEEDNAEDMEGQDLQDTSGEGYDSTPGERKVVAKGIYATDNEGTQNLDDANTILFDDLPEATQENVKEIRKALRRIGLDVAPMKRPVAKSMGASREVTELRQQVAFLAGTMQEMIEGMSVTKSVDSFIEPEERTVRKSKPQASYGDNDLVSVLKSLVENAVGTREREKEENPWNQKPVVRKSMREFTQNMGGLAGGIWGK